MAKGSGASRAKRPGGRFLSPSGVPRSQSITRTMFMAVAVSTCWRCVRAKPIYRLWRRAKRRTAWESVLSTPPERILRFELRRLLALPRRLERLVGCLGLHRELARRLGGRGTRLAGGTGPTGGPVKADANHRLASLTLPRGPFDTPLALGALRLLGLPINREGM